MVGSVLCGQIAEGNGGQFSALPVLPGPHPFLGAPCTKLFYLFALPLCMPFFHHAWRQCGRVDNYEPLLALLHVILAALTFNLIWHPFPWNNNKQTGDMTGYVQNGRRPQSKKKKLLEQVQGEAIHSALPTTSDWIKFSWLASDSLQDLFTADIHLIITLKMALFY